MSDVQSIDKNEQEDSGDALPALLDDIQQHFELITSGISNQDNYTIELANMHIQETDDLLKQLRTLLKERNLSGFPADVNEVSSIAANQKQQIDSIKHSLVQNTSNANAIVKAFNETLGKNQYRDKNVGIEKLNIEWASFGK